MSDIVIRAEGLSKRYRIGERERYYTLRDTLARAFTVPFRWLRSGRKQTLNSGSPHSTSISHSAIRNSQSDFIWALKDVSFEIKQGEVVGIIGRNGAGKSTLLKILSRITEPTEGEARIYGRVGSLLEVGTGFHSELTGRENIYLNGAILGMKKAEIDRRFDEIVAFAEVEKFLDTPVKHYSSGMYMRLAFSVAAHLEPEILIVDEVLAVGDIAFQKKCLGKMGEVAREGLTVLFVSHNMEAVQRLCNRCVLLSGGHVVRDGDTQPVVSSYMKDSHNNLMPRYRNTSGQGRKEDKAVLLETEILNEAGKPCQNVHFGEPFSVRMRWLHTSAIQGAAYAIRVHDERDCFLFAVNTLNAHLRIEKEGIHEVRCRFQHNVLVPGEYSVSIGCYVRPHTKVHAVEPCFKLVVVNVPSHPDTLFNIVGNPTFAMFPSWMEESV
jgi:homopolymeric O-antigen transport system ATP-binding protein